MTDKQQILELAIQKAVAGGWELKGGIFAELTPEAMLKRLIIGGTNEVAYKQLIFDREFAKALWGNLPEKLTFTQAASKPAPGKFLSSAKKLVNWQYHLREMVIADDTIKYLGDNLNDR